MSATGILLDAIGKAITRAPADAATASAARGVFTRATGPGCDWPDKGAKAIGGAVIDLGEALEFYQDILADELHPASAYEVLRDFQPEELRFAEALRMAAEEAADMAAEVIKVIREHAGDEQAAFVRGTKGGQQ